MSKVFVALGSNIGDRAAVLRQALEEIERIEQVFDLNCSNFYRTSPVSPIPQDDYLNAVCSFTTALTPKQLHCCLQKIETKLGKKPKPKEAPRILDLDLLFFGTEPYRDAQLEIPHPRWMERKFVLIPLADLAEELVVPSPKGNRLINIKKMIELLPNNESISKVDEFFEAGDLI
ncbi:MAG TPA: 2-amino-4-hydroxy-6-hydroxymethyldihydropteridine diphosphokinase [Waddliaceae bacterium]